jgi:hypothetical protein
MRTVSRHAPRVTLLALACIATASPSGAQESRAEAIAREQEAKERTAHPYTPTRGEAIAEQFEKGQWILSPNPRGFYPYFGSVYPGTGFTVGAGYRRYVGYESHFDVRALYAVSNSTLFEVAFTSPNRFGERVDVGGRLGRRNARGIAYYGLGMGSTLEGRSNVDLAQTYLDGYFTLRPKRWLELRAAAAYEDFGEGESSVLPSIGTVNTSSTAPRLGDEPSYVHGQVSGAIRWQQSPDYSRRGGLYRFTYHGYQELSPRSGRFGMNRGELVQHIPILRETWVLSLRGRMESILDETTVAPYFLLPYIGSGSTLRGYATGRFRGRHAVVTSAEWRWIPNRQGIDMALFVDAGTVAMRVKDLSLAEVEHDYGIGVRLHGPQVTVLRFELARGSEGWRAVFSTGAPF